VLFSLHGKKDGEVLAGMIPLMEELIKPMRFLSDLDAVWDELSDKERSDIEASRVYRERDHEKFIEARIDQLTEMTGHLKSFKYRNLRNEMQGFLGDWRSQEPDRVKVLQGLIRKNCDL
jgi:hypothetical protein